MNYILGLIGVAVMAVVGYLYERSKRRSAEALNDNLGTKEHILDIQKDVIRDQALIDSETIKQNEIKAKLEEDKKKDVSKDDLLDFFNRK